MIEDTQLDAFCAAVDAMRAPHFADMPMSMQPYARPLTFERGTKFARIVKCDGEQKSVFCFVRLEDGAILKAAGWKTPAKHARGNIANGAVDVGINGAAYLR